MHVAIVSSKRSLEDEVLKREFRRYMGPGRRDDALGWSRLASTVFVAKYVSSPTNSMNHYGIIGLKQKGRNDTNTSFKVIFNKLAKDNNQYPASVFSLVNLSASGTKTLASIYNILGLMGKLLSMTEKSDWKTSNESDKKNNILNELLGFYPNTNSVTQPVWVTSQEDIVDDDERDKTLLDEKKLSIENWLEPLHLWLNNAVILNQYIAPSSVMIGKLIPRLFYGLENKTYQTDFASSMELFALCVVNAFLAEESAFHLIESYGSKRIFLANPRTSAADYLQRLNKEFPKNSISKERLPLTFIVATCPLITGLISKKKAENNWPFSISDTDSTERGSNFIGESDWTYLSKISIAGKKESAAQNEKNKNNGKTEPPPSDTSTPGSE
jgi:hypothetical protein